MKNYTKTYLDFFGYKMSDFVPCEICGAESVDVHHIWARSIRKDLENEISNLMSLCREHHIAYGDMKTKREYLQGVHNKFMNDNGKSKTT